MPYNTRGDILAQLDSMGIDLGYTKTEIPSSKLEDKLNTALTSAQGVDNSEYPVDIGKLPAWTDTKDLVEAFPNGTAPKNLAIIRSLFGGAIPSVLNPVRAFSDVQRTIKEMAQNYVNGHEYSFIRDEDGLSAIHFRVLGVYKFNDTPLISLAYDTDNSRNLNKTTKFIDARVRAGARGIARITCTLEEQALLRHLLHLNSTRVAKTYQPRLEAAEDRYIISFFVPLVGLSQAQLGVLATNDGCHVCWAPASRFCQTCNAIKYCGRNCQRSNQKMHKDFDERMRGGRWTDATFVLPNAAADEEQAATDDHAVDIAASEKSLDPPQNLHGDNATLIRLHRSPTTSDTENGDAACILVHDRFHTFEVHIFKKDNPEFWEEAMKVFSNVAESARVYRFAKRTGDWTLSVCLDREPLGGPVW